MNKIDITLAKPKFQLILHTHTRSTFQRDQCLINEHWVDEYMDR